MTTELCPPKIKCTRDIDPREIHLQISLLKDAINNDRVKSPIYQSGKSLAPYAVDATTYARQYAERTMELSREFTKLYRLVVWRESSKNFKRHKAYKTVPFSLIEGDIHFQCQTLQNTSDVILGHLSENSDGFRYAQKVLRALIKRWLARHNQHELRTSEVPHTDTNSWPSPIYLFERNPATTFPIVTAPSDPYSPIDNHRKIHPLFIGILASFFALLSALFALAYPLILRKCAALPVLGDLSIKLSLLPTTTVLALQIFTAILALNCAIYLIYNKIKKEHYHPALIHSTSENSIPKLRRLSLESLNHVLEYTDTEDEDIEKNGDTEFINCNLDITQENKKTIHPTKQGTLIGQKLKSQKIFGLNCDFRSTMMLPPAFKQSPPEISPLPQDNVEQLEEEKDNDYYREFSINPIGETFKVVHSAIRCQGQEESINAELIHNLAMHAFTSVTWSQQAAQQSLQEILKLVFYPDNMLMLYHDLELHSLRHKIPIEFDLSSFEEAINAYNFLYQSEKKEQFSDKNTEVSNLIKKNGLFAFNETQKNTKAKKLLIILGKKLMATCKAHPEWPNHFLLRISELPWPLCEILIPYLINYRTDPFSNTLLHHLAIHPECSTLRFQEVFNQLYQHRFSREHEWHAYVTHTNMNGDDAGRVAFTVKRIEICKFLLCHKSKAIACDKLPQPQSK